MGLIRWIAGIFKKDFSERNLQKRLCPDQRGFDRYAVEFAVMVSGTNPQGEIFVEKSVLRDISGGGAMFVTSAPEKYIPGQTLKISIFLSGTNEVRARIQTEAIVVRIHEIDESGDAGSKQIGIAVAFDSSFEFERIDESGYR